VVLSIFEDRVVRDVVPVLEEFGVFDEVVALLELRVRHVKCQTDGTLPVFDQLLDHLEPVVGQLGDESDVVSVVFVQLALVLSEEQERPPLAGLGAVKLRTDVEFGLLELVVYSRLDNRRSYFVVAVMVVAEVQLPPEQVPVELEERRVERPEIISVYINHVYFLWRVPVDYLNPKLIVTAVA
jgi:hypothetical protein